MYYYYKIQTICTLINVGRPKKSVDRILVLQFRRICPEKSRQYCRKNKSAELVALQLFPRGVLHILRPQYEIISFLAEKLVALASNLLDLFSRPFLDLQKADEQDRIFIHRGFEEHTDGRHCITPQIWGLHQ